MNRWEGVMQNYNNDNEFASVVTMKDVERVNKMEKDQLKAWVNQPCTFNHVIDVTRPINHLRNQVIGMIKVRLGNEIDKKRKEAGKKAGDADATGELSLGYLLNPDNMRVFEATAALLRRTDFVPCDKNGERI